MEQLDRESLNIPPSAHLVRAVGSPGEPDEVEHRPEFYEELARLDEAEQESARQDIRDGIYH